VSTAAGSEGFDFELLCFRSAGDVLDTASRTSSGNFVTFSNFNLYRTVKHTLSSTELLISGNMLHYLQYLECYQYYNDYTGPQSPHLIIIVILV